MNGYDPTRRLVFQVLVRGIVAHIEEGDSFIFLDVGHPHLDDLAHPHAPRARPTNGTQYLPSRITTVPGVVRRAGDLQPI